jgi:hypothetical protein
VPPLWQTLPCPQFLASETGNRIGSVKTLRSIATSLSRPSPTSTQIPSVSPSPTARHKLTSNQFNTLWRPPEGTPERRRRVTGIAHYPYSIRSRSTVCCRARRSHKNPDCFPSVTRDLRRFSISPNIKNPRMVVIVDHATVITITDALRESGQQRGKHHPTVQPAPNGASNERNGDVTTVTNSSGLPRGRTKPHADTLITC